MASQTRASDRCSGSPPVLEVAICTYNRAELLEGALQSLSRQTATQSGTWQVLVVDNNCTDHTHSVVSEYAGRVPGLRVVTETRQGLTEARQRAFLASVAPWLAFVDDDCRPAPDWVDEVLRFIESTPQAAAFNGFNELRLADNVSRPWINAEMFAARNPTTGDEPVRRQELHGAGLVLRRQAVIRSGWLDTPYIDDRRGRSLVSGGDNALSMLAATGGENGGLWFVPRIRLEHVIDAGRLRLGYLLRLVFRLAESRPLIEAMSWPSSKRAWHVSSARSTLRRIAGAVVARSVWPDRLGWRSAIGTRARLVLLGWSRALGYAVGYARLGSNPARLDELLGLVSPSPTDQTPVDSHRGPPVGPREN